MLTSSPLSSLTTGGPKLREPGVAGRTDTSSVDPRTNHTAGRALCMPSRPRGRIATTLTSHSLSWLTTGAARHREASVLGRTGTTTADPRTDYTAGQSIRGLSRSSRQMAG